MQIHALRTPRITPSSISLRGLLDVTITELQECQIVVITSKIVSLCEGNVISTDEVRKEDLVIEESDRYLDKSLSKYGFHFTITNDTLIPMAGIDESNTGGYFVLWPRDAQSVCNNIRQYLCERFEIKHAGVIITDSTCQPLRTGTAGIALAHSGFLALNDYVGKPDLFGRPMRVTQSDISGGIAAAAVLCMGEGAECTPLAVISNADVVSFQSRNPTSEELAMLRIPLEEDLFAPFLQSVEWQEGKRGAL